MIVSRGAGAWLGGSCTTRKLSEAGYMVVTNVITSATYGLMCSPRDEVGGLNSSYKLNDHMVRTKLGSFCSATRLWVALVVSALLRMRNPPFRLAIWCSRASIGRMAAGARGGAEGDPAPSARAPRARLRPVIAPWADRRPLRFGEK
ncbi:hypothetical protein EVAR_20805_1 [Eumeta japonica]|uniref:Uncharacterized protein n=1 Tax=Eumeta variegata TaxID=151549 RepID=A0A4C1UDF4_EUMVA|nr:hypothetical protein EVAR_20805_1 [Eumeta japonica]